MVFSVDGMFSDHMVLRYSRPDPVWGNAPAGAEVTAEYCGASARCTAGADGKWLMWLDAPAENACGALTVRCGGNEIRFEDVVTGAVFLCGGQSNMEQPLMCADNGRYWAERAPRDNVRLKYIPRQCTDEAQPGWHFFADLRTDAPWRKADRDSAAEFSAAGYIFGAKLSGALGMPVGLIDCNWGGTRIQSWLPEEEIMAQPDTREDLRRYREVREALGERASLLQKEYTDSVRAVYDKHEDYITGGLNDPLWFLTDDHTIRFPPEGADGFHDVPGLLYEKMVAKVVPFGLNGVLWYQGEANGGIPEAPRYFGLFGRLLCTWRAAFRDAELPFLTCQIASFDCTMYGINGWVELQRQQTLCAEHYKNVSMAVLNDIGMERNIHPLWKEPVADRLCRAALKDLFGIGGGVSVPKPVSCTRDGDSFILKFSLPVVMRDGELPYAKDAAGEKLECRVEQAGRDALRLTPGGSAARIAYADKAWLVPGLFAENGDPVPAFEYLL